MACEVEVKFFTRESADFFNAAAAIEDHRLQFVLEFNERGDFIRLDEHECGRPHLGICCIGGADPDAAATLRGHRIGALRMNDVVALDRDARGAECLIADLDAEGFVGAAEIDRPCVRANGEDRAGTGAEQRVLHAPVFEQRAELIEGEAFADAAEVDFASGFDAGDRWRFGIDREDAGERRRCFIGA